MSMQAKKGDLSINFIIVAALALIVLIAVALFFTGGIQKLFGTQKGAVGVTVDPQVRALAVSSCKLYCSVGNNYAYNNPNFPEDLRTKYTNCVQLLSEELGASGAYEENCGSCAPKADKPGADCTGDTKSKCGVDCDWTVR